MLAQESKGPSVTVNSGRDFIPSLSREPNWVDKHALRCVFTVSGMPSREASSFSSHYNFPHHMTYLATTSRLAVFAMLLTVPALAFAQTPGEHDSGPLQTAAYDEGSWGRDAGFGGTGFIWAGEQGLFAGNLLIGQSATQISGQAYANPQEFTTVSAIVSTTPSDPDFDQGFMSEYDDSGLGDPLGVSVVQNSWTSTIAGFQTFVYYNYAITNNSGGDLTGIYVGNFSDWDVMSAVDNQACYDPAGQVLYVWSEAGGNYFGTAVVNNTVSGWDADGSAGNPDDAGVWAAMTNGGGVCSTTAGDRRVTIGQGPYDIANGETITAEFCMVGGTDAADINANAEACAAAVMPVAIEPGPDGVPGTHNLSAVYPNPFNPQARFTLEVAEQQNVRLAVYDALGREVATLYNGTLSAGPAHEFAIDGAGLPSGVYVVRATGEQFTDVRRVTLTK